MNKKVEKEFIEETNISLTGEEWEYLSDKINSSLQTWGNSDSANTHEITIYQDKNKKIRYRIFTESTMYDAEEGEV